MSESFKKERENIQFNLPQISTDASSPINSRWLSTIPQAMTPSWSVSLAWAEPQTELKHAEQGEHSTMWFQNITHSLVQSSSNAHLV